MREIIHKSKEVLHTAIPVREYQDEHYEIGNADDTSFNFQQLKGKIGINANAVMNKENIYLFHIFI